MMLKGELFTLSMFSLLGILVMVSANNFLVVYLGLELMSLPPVRAGRAAP